MSRPWTAEWSVDAALAARLIGTRFPRFQGAEVRPLGGGWDNTAFLVDGSWVFRFPRKESAAALLRTECAVLPRLEPHLPLRIPTPVWVSEPQDPFPWPFAGYALLQGETACRMHLTPSERRQTAPGLGRFVRALHGLPSDGLPLPPDELQRDRFAHRLAAMEERLTVLARAGVIDNPSPWMGLLEAGAEPTGSPGGGTVVHGDLYARHLIVATDRTLTGVIDWGDVHLGSPATDLMVAFGFFPPGARADFFDAYGAVPEEWLSIARRRAAFHAAAVTWYGLESDDPALLAEGRTALAYVLDRA
ncbi:MAG: phosphotransferase [Gemmatimonadota bacterium]